MKKLKSPSELDAFRKRILKNRSDDRVCISICCGTGCRAYGAKEVADEFIESARRMGTSRKVEIKQTGCHGFCERGPLVVIYPKKIFYQRVKKEHIDEIIKKTALGDEILKRFLYFDPLSKDRKTHEDEINFYRLQERQVLKNNGLVDPTKIADYLALDGYKALQKCLFELKPDEVIREIKAAGLRGRGGAGFPTGKKWELLASQNHGTQKYLVCNGDEGDPGAYMDRSVLEGNPQSVIEGMIIGGYATGATEGLFYVRAEYPLAIEHLLKALEQAKKLGLLGKNVLGSKFSFNLRLVQGAGAFVCGEETALIKSVEGQRSVPVPRPPFPVEHGINGCPTAINNVETWANVPIVIRDGARSYSRTGTKTSSGTKIFSLVGKIMNTGLVEVPMGISIREIVERIGGGPSGKAKVKAVQTGGPSGGCIPAEMFDLTIDYESLSSAGSMMGSGGLIVMDEHTCMVDVAKYFLKFTADESCGKCTTCRVGIRQMVRILEKITTGCGEPADLDRLEHLATTIKDGSLCGLGQTAPNPVLTTLKYFRNEFEAHVYEKRCPATVCRDLIQFRIIPELCKGCMRCIKVCPTGAIAGELKEPHTLDQEKCVKCGSCFDICNLDAVIGEPVHNGHYNKSRVSS